MKTILNYKVKIAEYEQYLKNNEPTMVTTQHNCGDTVLTKVVTNKSLNSQLQNFIKQSGGKGKLKKSSYFSNLPNSIEIKAIDKVKFNLKLKSYKTRNIITTMETLVKYNYVDLDGQNSSIQIVIEENNKGLSALIEFSSNEQYANFRKPDWLVPN